MPSSADALLIAIFAFLPGVIASGVWLRAGDIRAYENPEERRGSILVWSAFCGFTNLFIYSRIKYAAQHAMGTGAEMGELMLLASTLIIMPTIIGVLAGWLVRNEPIRDKMQYFGLISPNARTPWDNLTSHNVRTIEVVFTDEGKMYRGYIARTDTNATQVYLNGICELNSGKWIQRKDITGVLLFNGKKKVWLREIEYERANPVPKLIIRNPVMLSEESLEKTETDRS